ncbi:MAG: lysylphosphatidylglycerol synthase domain-containing protein [Thermoleophilia bacterium]
MPAGREPSATPLLLDPLRPDIQAVPRRRRPSVRTIGAVTLATALVAVAVYGASRLDLGAAASALGGADPQMLAAALALYAVAQTAGGAMWAVCQTSGGVRGVPLGTALGMHWMARAACEILPACLGETARAALVRRHPGGAEAGTLRIVGGIAGYKLVEGVVTAVAVVALTLVVPLPGPAAGLRWTAAAAVVAIVVAAIAWRLGAGRRLARLIPRRTRASARRVGEGAAVVTDGPAARTAAALGLVLVVARMLSLAALLMALGAPAAAAALAFCLIALAGALPIAPGGAGAREVVLVPALALAYGLPASTALAFSVAVQATALITSLALGAAALAWLGPRLLGRGGPVPEPLVAEA